MSAIEKVGTRSWTARPVALGLATLALASVFATLRLQGYHWNPSGFVHAGGIFVDPKTAPEGLLIRRHEIGFDGAAFYRLALDPFTRTRVAHGIPLDLPAFRQQRIVYPLIAWAASGGGKPRAAAWALILENLIGLGIIGWLAGILAIRLGRSMWWGAIVSLYPGFVVSLALDTAEIVAAAFALGAIVMLLRKRYAGATVLLVCAMLTRETTLLVAAGVAIAWFVARVRRTPHEESPPAYVALIPVLAYGVVQLILHARWGTFALGQGGDVDLAVPLWGLIVAIKGWPKGGGEQTAYQVVLAIAMIAFTATAARALRVTRAPRYIVFGFAVSALLAVGYSEAIWLHHWGFLRAFVECYLLGCGVLLAAKANLQRLTIGAGALWFSLALNLVLHP